MSLDIIIENAVRILEVFRTGRSAPKVYRLLCEEMPELKKVSLESFRTYLPVMDKFEKRYPIANRRAGNGNHKAIAHVSHEKSPTYKINGWNLTAYCGYYRAFKRFNGILHGVYVGKCLDDAAKKIMAKETAILEQGARDCIP